MLKSVTCICIQTPKLILWWFTFCSCSCSRRTGSTCSYFSTSSLLTASMSLLKETVPKHDAATTNHPEDVCQWQGFQADLRVMNRSHKRLDLWSVWPISILLTEDPTWAVKFYLGVSKKRRENIDISYTFQLFIVKRFWIFNFSSIFHYFILIFCTKLQ